VGVSGTQGGGGTTVLKHRPMLGGVKRDVQRKKSVVKRGDRI